MKPRCWVGCVARVILAELPENVGRTCVVVDEIPNGRWIVRFCVPIAWLFPIGPYGQLHIVYDDTGPADDHSLMPLIPPPGTAIGDTELHEPGPVPAEA